VVPAGMAAAFVISTFEPLNSPKLTHDLPTSAQAHIANANEQAASARRYRQCIFRASHKGVRGHHGSSFSR
jgi:hypothetical protein